MNSLMLAQHIANAASFFDTASCAIPAQQQEATRHIERLHDAAQILAGDRNAEVYSPDDGHFVGGKHYAREIQVGLYNAPIELVHWREQDGEVCTAIRTMAAGFSLHLSATPTQCRELAAALKQFADDAESSAAQPHRQQRDDLTVLQAAGLCVAGETA